jgi:hypothetical protein
VSKFESGVLIGLAFVLIALFGIVDELRKGNRHKSNIAARLLDIYLHLKGR